MPNTEYGLRKPGNQRVLVSLSSNSRWRFSCFTLASLFGCIFCFVNFHSYQHDSWTSTAPIGSLENSFPNVILATRTWSEEDRKDPCPCCEQVGISPDLPQSLCALLLDATSYSQKLLVAVNTERDKGDTLNKLPCVFHLKRKNVEVVGEIQVTDESINAPEIVNNPYDVKSSRRAMKSACQIIGVNVNPWGGITGALNAMISVASAGKIPPAESALILFQSPEIHAEPQHIRALLSFFQQDPDHTLVVGAALKPSNARSNDISAESDHQDQGLSGHDFQRGVHNLTGLTIPWNTLALWNLGFLNEVAGFDPVANTVDPPGMEEVTAIVHAQRKHGVENRKVILVDFSASQNGGSSSSKVKHEVTWATDFSSAARREKHAKKMRSKLKRVKSILSRMNAQGFGQVEHVAVEI